MAKTCALAVWLVLLAAPASAQFKIATGSASAAADAVVDRLDAGSGPGTLVIFGSACPDAANDADSGTTLAVLTFSDPAFGSASNGVATANAITADASANATGTAMCFRAKDSNGNVAFQGSITTSGGGGNLILSSTSITAGQSVAITALTFTQPTQTADIFAPSCSKSDVETALNAAEAGDVIAIPAGTCTWTAGIDWLAMPANVTIRGAGDSSLGGGDDTVLIDSFVSDHPLIRLIPSTTGVLRVTGLTFQGGSSGDNVKVGGVIAFGGVSAAATIRLDHSHFINSTYSTASGRAGSSAGFSGTYGVVDHNIFDESDNAVRIFGVPTSNERWAEPTALGSDDFIFFEDNTFVEKTANDCQGAGRFVFRYNTFTSSGIQVHPTGATHRGCRAWEIYGNTFQGLNDPPSYVVFFVSSGVGVVWGNSVTTEGYKNFIAAYSMRRNDTTYTAIATPNGWGYCGTSFNGTGSNWDGNTNASTGYPCLDQPGQGQGDLLTGDFPSVTNSATGCVYSAACAWPRQALEPTREWLNLPFTPAPGYGGSFFTTSAPEVLQANRDYYLYTASFTGASGIGSGARSSRPSTCTTGTAWWSTDQGGNWKTSNGDANDGTLDVCTATNTWTNASYTPYTYPHPLR